MNSFEYKDSKYDIIGFEVNERESKQYKIERIFGLENHYDWIFNINGRLIGFENSNNFHLDSYSAKVDDDYLHVLTDFDYFKINLKTLECENHIDLGDHAPFDEIYKFNNGYVFIGEMDIIYIENNSINWMYNSSTYIEYAIVCKDNSIEVVENEPYNKFFINKKGEIIK